MTQPFTPMADHYDPATEPLRDFADAHTMTTSWNFDALATQVAVTLNARLILDFEDELYFRLWNHSRIPRQFTALQQAQSAVRQSVSPIHPEWRSRLLAAGITMVAPYLNTLDKDWDSGLTDVTSILSSVCNVGLDALSYFSPDSPSVESKETSEIASLMRARAQEIGVLLGVNAARNPQDGSYPELGASSGLILHMAGRSGMTGAKTVHHAGREIYRRLYAASKITPRRVYRFGATYPHGPVMRFGVMVCQHCQRITPSDAGSRPSPDVVWPCAQSFSDLVSQPMVQSAAYLRMTYNSDINAPVGPLSPAK